MARILAVCASSKRNEAKSPLDSAEFVRDAGIRGDSHFASGRRQISLLRSEDVAIAAGKAGFAFPPGSLAENLLVEGLPGSIAVGSRLRLGEEVLLEVIERGKRPDEEHLYDFRGWCLLPTMGYFLRVVTSGKVRSGDVVTME